MSDDLDQQDAAPGSGGRRGSFCRCKQLSTEATLLWTALLNGVFAISQGVASFLSHSLSLLGDSGDMAVDTLTYLLAYYIERQKARSPGRRLSRRLQISELVVAFISGLTLVVASVVILIDALKRLATPPPTSGPAEVGGDEPQEVNGAVILGFSSFNLAVDIAQILLFFCRRRHGAGDAAGEDEMRELCGADGADGGGGGEEADEEVGLRGADALSAGPAGQEDATASQARQRKTTDINFWAAFTHVAADTLRTMSEIVAALLIEAFHFDSIQTDARTAIVINVTILASGLFICANVVTRSWSLHEDVRECGGSSGTDEATM